MQGNSSSETVIKAYSMPIHPDEFLLKFIDDYHELAKTILEEILNAERFTKVERKQLRDKLLEEWEYASHYIDSAINQMLGLVNSYRKKLRRGERASKPRLRKKFVYVKSTLVTLNGPVLSVRITRKGWRLQADEDQSLRGYGSRKTKNSE